MEVEANLVGHTLGGYRIAAQIGQGGMAAVFKAYEPSLDRYVAIKVLPRYLRHEPDFAARFEQEARAVAKLDHPNILPIYGYGQEEGWTFIVMRYVEAGTLKDLLTHPLDLQTVAHILAQIGQALSYAHQQGIVHRDVKPSNVLIADGKWALLTDFGLARMVESSVRLTQSGVGVGTPAYMSPEQGQGIAVDARSDVYSLGVVLYEMVTGKLPYEAETPMAVVLQHITAPLPLPRTVNPDLPEAVERVILKAMAKEPGDRFQTAEEMVEALERAVSGAAGGEEVLVAAPLPGERAAPASRPARAPAALPFWKRWPWWAWAAIGVLLLASIGGALLATGFLHTEEDEALPSGSGTFVDSGQRLGGTLSRAVALGDLDDDGVLDAVVGDSNLGAVVWLNDGVGDLADSGQRLRMGDADIYAVALGDLDGDGDLDVYLGNYVGADWVWLNDGQGNFVSNGQSLGSGQTTTVALGDLDDDGDLDAVVGKGIEQALPDEVWINDSEGRFADSGQRLGDSTSWAVALGDLDDDGDLDALLVSSGISKVWFNNGLAAFSEGGQRLGPLDSVAVALGDLDDDGDLDAVVGIPGADGNPNIVWLNDGAGSLYDSGRPLGYSVTQSVALGDLDDDGDLDLVVGNALGQANEVWFNNGQGILTDSGQALGSASTKGVALGDLDDDGDLDAFVANEEADEVWLNQ